MALLASPKPEQNIVWSEPWENSGGRMERDRAQATHRSKEHCLTATSAEDVWDMTRDVRSCRMLIHAHLQREILVVRGNRSSKQGRSNCVGLTTDEDICVSERKKASKCVSRGEASFVITRELSGRAKVQPSQAWGCMPTYPLVSTSVTGVYERITVSPLTLARANTCLPIGRLQSRDGVMDREKNQKTHS